MGRLENFLENLSLNIMFGNEILWDVANAYIGCSTNQLMNSEL